MKDKITSLYVAGVMLYDDDAEEVMVARRMMERFGLNPFPDEFTVIKSDEALTLDDMNKIRDRLRAKQF